MATSLAAQLAGLGRAGRDRFAASDKLTASFLFSAEQAAEIDLTTTCGLGSNGIEGLLQLDPTGFSRYTGLFGPATANTNRDLLTAAENSALDRRLTSLLRALSAYLLQSVAHNALEWLVRRYAVHVHNAEALVEAFLPYHGTKLFARMLQLLSVPALPAHWAFLQPLRAAGAPLSREVLVARCARDHALLAAVCASLAQQAAEAPQLPTPVASQLARLYASLLTGVVDAASPLPDRLLRTLLGSALPFLELPARSAAGGASDGAALLRPLRVAALMVLAHVSALNPLAADVVLEILGIAAAGAAGCYAQFVGLVVVACEQTRQLRLPGPVLQQLAAGPMGWASAAEIGASSPRFQLTLLLSLLEEDGGTAFPAALPLFPALGDLGPALCRRIVATATADNGNGSTTNTDAFRVCVKAVEARFPQELDLAIRHATSTAKDVSGLVQLLANNVSRMEVPDAGVSLALSLQHPEAAIRLLAVEQLEILASDPNLPDTQFLDLENTVLQRLHDSAATVADRMLLASRALQRCLSPAAYPQALSKLLLADLRHKRPDAERVQEATRQLLGLDAELSVEVEATLLHHLFFTVKRRRLAMAIAHALSSGGPAAERTVLLPAADALAALVAKPAFSHNGSDAAALAALNSELLSATAARLVAYMAVDEAQFQSWLDQAGSALRRGQSHGLAVLALAVAQAGQAAPPELHWTALKGLLSLLQHCGTGPTTAAAVRSSPTVPLVRWLTQTGPGKAAPLSVLSAVLAGALTHLSDAISTAGEAFDWAEARPRQGPAALLVELFGALTRLTRASSSLAHAPLQALLAALPPSALLRYLACVWTNLALDAWTRQHALRLAAVYLRSGPAELPSEVESDLQHVLPYLLAALFSRFRPVRAAALDCIEACASACEALPPAERPKLPHISAIRNGDFGGLLASLRRQATALVGDEAHLRTLLANRFAATKLPRTEEETLAFFVTATLSVPDLNVRAAAWSALHDVGHPLKVLRALADADALLDRFQLLDAEELDLLRLLMGSVSERSFKQLRKYKPKTAAKHCYKTLCTALHVRLSLEEPAAEQFASWLLGTVVAPPVFAAMPEEEQRHLFDALYALCAGFGDDDVGAAARDVLLAVPIPVDFAVGSIRRILDADLAEQEAEDGRTDGRKRRRGARTTETSNGTALTPGPAARPEALVEIGELLDLVLSKPAGTVAGLEALLPTLFDVLRLALGLPDRDQASLEHTKQCVVTGIRQVLKHALPDATARAGAENTLDVELLVQCVRRSKSPQTHHHAMLLLADLAAHFPERVLHSIMPVFTFMGENLVAQDNSFSLQVIERTVSTIVPALLQTKGGFATTVRVIGVFVDAFHHIPAHRLDGMFQHLVTTLGPPEYLHVVTALLLKKQVLFEAPARGTQAAAAAAAAAGGVKASLPQFCRDLFLAFGLEDQVAALTKLVALIPLIPVVPAAKGVPAEVRVLFSPASCSARQCERFRAQLAGYVAGLLGFEGFLHAVVRAERASSRQCGVELRDRFVSFIQGVLVAVTAVRPARGASHGRHGQAVVAKLYVTLERANAILGTQTFAQVVERILAGDDDEVRLKALSMLAERVAKRAPHKKRDAKDLLALIGPLEAILHGRRPAVPEEEGGEDAMEEGDAIEDGEEEGEASPASPAAVQAAVYTLNVYLEAFGDESTDRFRETPAAVTAVLQAAESVEVRSSCLVCLGTCCVYLQVEALPALPGFMPAVVAGLQAGVSGAVEGAADSAADAALLGQSAASAARCALEHLPAFVGPYLKALVPLLTRSPGQGGVGQLGQKLETCRQLLADRVAARVLLPPCFSHFNVLFKKIDAGRIGSLELLFGVLVRSTATMPLADVKVQVKSLYKLCLTAFDYYIRAYDDPAVGVGAEPAVAVATASSEAAALDLLVGLTMRLSEETFRPLYLKLVDWATNSQSTLGHRRLFFRLIGRLAAQLKFVFVPYFSNILQLCVDVLALDAEEEGSDGGGDGDEDREPGLCAETQALVVEALSLCFLYDEVKFTTKDRFHGVMKPLAQQLASRRSAESDDACVARCRATVIPCLAHLATAVADLKCWKALHHEVIIQSRDEEPTVRLCAVALLQQLFQVLGDEFLGLLPETIPALAEALEDDDLRVEKETQATIKTIEGFLGESLQKYLQ